MISNNLIDFITNNLEYIKKQIFLLGGGTKITKKHVFKNKLGELIPEFSKVPWIKLLNSFRSLGLVDEIAPTYKSSYSGSIYVFFPDDHNIYTISNIFFRNSYFSHFTALSLSQLIKDKSNTIYMTNPKRNINPQRDLSISQKKIDIAFSKSMRKSQNIIYILWKKKTYKIISIEGLRLPHNDFLFSLDPHLLYSNLELSLVDAAVRPQYSGGVNSVIEAFKSAEKYIDTEKLACLINFFNHTYPYERNIALFMKLANYNKNKTSSFLSLIKKEEVSYTFYLDYQLAKKTKDEEYNIFYPG